MEKSKSLLLPRLQEVREGETVTFTCQYFKSTFPEFPEFPEWRGPPSLSQYTNKDGDIGAINPEIPAASRLKYASNNRDLILSKAVKADTGDYTCLHPVPENNFTFTLRVLPRMLITALAAERKRKYMRADMFDDDVEIDDVLILVCDDTTYTAGNTYVWKKDDIPIFTNAGEVSPAGKYSERIVGTSFQLVINRIDASDKGTYIASHNCESASLNLKVTPHDRTVTAKLSDRRLEVLLDANCLPDSVKVTCNEQTVKGSFIQIMYSDDGRTTWRSELPLPTLPRSLRVTFKVRYSLEADSCRFYLRGHFTKPAEYTARPNEGMTQIGNVEVKLIKTDVIVHVGTDVNIPWNYPDSDHMVRVTWTFIGAGGAATVILLQESGLDAVVQNRFNIRHNTNGDVTITGVTVANSGTYRITVEYSSATVTDDVKVFVYDTTDANVPPGVPPGVPPDEETCCSSVSQPFANVSIQAISCIAGGAARILKELYNKIPKEKICESGKRILEQVTGELIANQCTGNGKKGKEKKDEKSEKGEENKDDESRKGEENKGGKSKKEETDPDNGDRSQSFVAGIVNYFKEWKKDEKSKKDDPTFDAHYSDSSTEEEDKDVKSETGEGNNDDESEKGEDDEDVKSETGLKDKDDNSKKGDENKDDESKKGEDDQDDKEKDKPEEDRPEVPNPFAD